MSPTARHLWLRSRGPLTALVVLVLFGLVYAVVRSGEHHGRLDPRSPDPQGSRAVAQLLVQRGVTVHVVTTTAEAAARTGPDTTLLVAVPDLLTEAQLARLHDAMVSGGGRTVLLAPSPTALTGLAPDVEAVAPAEVTSRSPRCDFAAARRAGSVDLGGILYATSLPGADSCYPADGHASLLRLPSQEGPDGPGVPAGSGGAADTVVLGAPNLLFNDRLDKQGNASLALHLLGGHPTLVWYLPSLSDEAASGEPRGFLDLLPDGWRWGALQLAIAAGVAALWRARRLGPVVAEPLPVTVRAAEATEGRARLYRRANARARAAEALRHAARSRLAPLVGVPPSRTVDPDAFAAAVAARTGRPAPEVRSLLYGAAPGDDAALLRLADALDSLQASIHDWQVGTS